MKDQNNNSNIEQILDSHGIEVSKYWENMLKTLPPYELGVIKASGKLLVDDSLEQLCSELAYLASHDFYVPLVIGGGVQYDQLPSYSSSKKVNGLRITTKELMQEMTPVAMQNQNSIIDMLKEKGIDAVLIAPENIFVQPHGSEINSEGEAIDTGYVGDVVSINTKPIISAILNKQVPVISHIGMHKGQLFNVNATTIAKELVKYLQAKKLIVLGDTPIYDSNGDIIDSTYSELEFKNLVQNGVIQGGMITNGTEAYDLLKYLGPGHSVQITALKKDTSGHITSTGLLEELLGNGSGTKMMMPFVITSYPIKAIQEDELTSLINCVFKEKGKKLVDDYFDIIGDKNPSFYLEQGKQGGAIAYELPDSGYTYLCKIFTHKDYEGIGIAGSVIDTILSQKGSLVWRAANDNECALMKYEKVVSHYGETSSKGDDYTVFTIGVPEYHKEAVVKAAMDMPKTMEVIE